MNTITGIYLSFDASLASFSSWSQEKIKAGFPEHCGEINHTEGACTCMCEE